MRYKGKIVACFSKEDNLKLFEECYRDNKLDEKNDEILEMINQEYDALEDMPDEEFGRILEVVGVVKQMISDAISIVNEPCSLQ